MSRMTVFTATYNRAHTLRRGFESLMAQTVKDFEWLIIDDGSVDSTEELIGEFIKKADFPIRYYKKQNGGRHTAVNYSHQFINTTYVVTMDSDDELMPDAIEKMLKTWDSIPKEEYDRFWCISGREMCKSTGKMHGKPYPKGVNELKGKSQRKAIVNISGEKHCCRKTQIYTQYKFPEYSDVKFITENMVWEQINRKYDQYCVNDFYGIYYDDSPDGLATGNMHKSTRHKSFYYAAVYYVNDLFDEVTYNRHVQFYMVNLPRWAMMSDVPYKEVMNSLNKGYKRALVTMLYPLSYAYIKIKKLKR